MEKKPLTPEQLQQVREAAKMALEQLQVLAEVVAKALRQVLDAILEAVRRMHEWFTRGLFELRLTNLGVPPGWAGLIARRWPHRLLPERWAWELILGPPGALTE